MTQSLLANWQFCASADRMDEFKLRLSRKPQQVSSAMQAGTDFEREVTNAAMGYRPNLSLPQAEQLAVRRFGRQCFGAVAQVPIWGRRTVAGIDFVLYGVCDFVQAGRIYDIKRVQRYEYGKYYTSPQHPMYLALMPEATRFDYLIFDGSRTYRETYRRGDFVPIELTIREFVRYLIETNNMDLYLRHWGMNEERQEKINGIYQC